jgi:Ni/Co efflux regulator RcnB
MSLSSSVARIVLWTVAKENHRMKTQLRTAACAIALLVATAGMAQHTQFDEHDRQVTQQWYNQNQSHAPRGLRSQDQLSADQEARLQPGKPLDRELRRKAYSAPSELRHQLRPAPAHHRYMTLGGHVVLVDSRDNTVRDVIHVHH